MRRQVTRWAERIIGQSGRLARRLRPRRQDVRARPQDEPAPAEGTQPRDVPPAAAVRTSAPQPAPRPRPPATPPPATPPPGPPAPAHRAQVNRTPPRQGRHLVYAPELDGRADPGEIVWTWVPYEEDPHRGKDRPVLVVGRDAETLYGLMLSSNAERDGQPNWYALGAGAWDAEHRPSWVRLDRVIVVAENGIRREGAVLDRRRFDAIAGHLRREYDWD